MITVDHDLPPTPSNIPNVPKTAGCPWGWRRTISAALPSPASQYFAFHGGGLVFLVPVPFGAHLVNLVAHSFQQGFGRRCGDARSGQLGDFPPLAGALDPPSFNLRPAVPE